MTDRAGHMTGRVCHVTDRLCPMTDRADHMLLDVLEICVYNMYV